MLIMTYYKFTGGMNQGQQNHGMPPGPPGMPPPFGMPPPGEFGMPPPGEFGPPPGEFGPPPGMGPGGMNGPRGLLPPPGFPDGKDCHLLTYCKGEKWESILDLIYFVCTESETGLGK